VVAVGRTSHALFFDGVSDSVILPQGTFTGTGVPGVDGKDSRNILQNERRSGGDSPLIAKEDGDLVIEAWVVPDCGGVIAHREGQFTLSLGTVDTPGPATFDLLLEGSEGIFQAFLTTALEDTNRWDGVVYPHHEGDLHDSYNRFDTSNQGEATNLNAAHRPLYHVVAGFSLGEAFLYVNGDLVASQRFDDTMRIARSTEHVYVGGKGGEFRGAIESLHFLGHYHKSVTESHMPTQSDASTGLYRFEEPIDVISGTYTFNAVSADSTTITVSAADAQALIARFTGKAYDSSSPTLNLEASPYSMGDYKVKDYYTAPATPTTLEIPHVPYNLLINPGAITRSTQKPNQKPPERIRVKNINGSTGVITLTSIHVDFVNGTNGLRGLLHARTADVDNYFVVVAADLLIDNGTGKPFQPPHYGTQVFDRTGQMVIDETDNAQHGLVYSSRMATTTTDTNNPFAVVWPSTLDTLFQVGHSGRHTFSHVVGHEYMRRFPKPDDMTVDQTVSGAADIVTMTYEQAMGSIKSAFVVNSLTDFYSENVDAIVTEVVSSSTAESVVHNGLPSAAREIIGIGGANFDHRPFMLKGPVPHSTTSINDDTRLFHLTPETTSRIAILHVPALQSSYDMAPFVEVHYNAIDLTGASMSISGPMLMVEKTVPAASLALGGGAYVYDVIAAALSTTLHAPGGMVVLDEDSLTTHEFILDSHTLLGDNTGGQVNDTELDFSRTPNNYTPVSNVNADPRTTPQATKASHVSLTHDSVYNRLVFNKGNGSVGTSFTSIGDDYKRITPTEEKSGAGVFDVGLTDGRSHTHEMFDIIDNYYSRSGEVYIFVQPSDRRRSHQLRSVVEDETSVAVMLLMARARLRSVSEEVDPETNDSRITVSAAGVVESALNRNVSALGDGSPDSYVVKEIEPNAPVVTVTLGGPGQGAVNTKPTFDPSPLMRLPGTTRRSCAVRATHVFAKNDNSTTTNILSVAPLNNGSPDVASWGTIAFPKVGRVYLENGASAGYASKGGAGFVFTNVNPEGTGRFLDGDGTEYANFFLWCNAVGLMAETSTPAEVETSLTLFNDPHFADESMAQDGSTVNDRLFQAMDTVSHDYQLGTQFASTRAMVEIPVFPQQFFDHPEQAIFPGPDNSMKLHLDATYTAHTWNPTPVGRRTDDIHPADKQASSAYGYVRNDFVASARVLRVEDTGSVFKIHVDNASVFPRGDLANDSLGNMKSVGRFRRCFTSDGHWAIYTNNAASDGFLSIPHSGAGHANHGIAAEAFFAHAVPGSSLFVAQGFRGESLIPIDSDNHTPSSDYEGRSPYYYDAANMQTQGGNLDYGMRQYVSAVEFKAGPMSNPHAPRTVTKNATATIVSVPSISGNSYTITVDDGSLFPDVPFTRDSSNAIQFEAGDSLYIAEIIQEDGSSEEVYYLGRFSSAFTENTFAIVSTSSPTNLVGATIRLDRVSHALHSISSPATAVTEEKKVMTFLPPNNEYWVFNVAASSGATTTLNIAPSTNAYLLAHANTFGLNIRSGDKVYVDDGSTISYLGEVDYVKSNNLTGGNHQIELKANNAAAISINNKIRVGAETVLTTDPSAILNRSWVYPYAAGGLRSGDTVWANMSLNNPHAVEGLFAKSRGVFNEELVWKGFNGGRGALATRPRDSIPMENFLIGNSCLETAINYVQHVNKTIEENYEAMGLDASQAPTVAYVDPYLATDGHARVLLYDVGHDREFIAFHDLHMQVQTSAATPSIGYTQNLAYEGGTTKLDKFLMGHNGGAPHYLTTQIDVANGFPSENPFLRSTQQSNFMESAYAHDIIGKSAANTYTSTTQSWTVLNNPTTETYNALFMSKGHGHFVHTGLYHEANLTDRLTVGDSTLPRVQPAAASPYWGNEIHKLTRIQGADHPLINALRNHRAAQNPSTHSLSDPSTTFDTPDGTRTVSAFLALKGKRSTTLSLADHEESRLQHLPHWTQMDFVRRMTIDFGEVGVKEGVTDIEAAAREIVRLINQGGAESGRTHARRPSHQYPGESERLDLTRIGVRQDIANPNRDPSASHINADFAATGSTYDPAPWWYPDEAFDSHDRGSHMGYLRAHIGRVVEDLDGNEGFSIVIHSTVPGASSRNFCAWLDNSKGQSTFKPQYLIGHGGRFRNFWSQPDETLGENMHPAPLPMNKHGRPFAPITSLREYVAQEEPDDALSSNLDVAARSDTKKNTTARRVSSVMGGTNNNSVADESFEAQSPATALVEGLRRGSTAIGRINFGGLVAAGVPGFAPDAGDFGLGRRGDTRFNKRYGNSGSTDYTTHVPTASTKEDAVGDTPLYGFRFADHRGRGHGVRYVYRSMDDAFANELTVLPSTLDDEIVVYINDSDVSRGGFTLGHHMLGTGDATGRITPTSNMTEASWVGNRWRGVYAADAGVDCKVTYNTGNSLTVAFEAPYTTSASDYANHPDFLGFLGFPLTNGTIQLTDPYSGTGVTAHGSTGNTFTYETRSSNDVTGTHTFYGVTGADFTVSHFFNGATFTDTATAFKTNAKKFGLLITPRLNWTTLLTDEVLAHATVAAINLTDPNVEQGVAVDVRHLYAADGRTLGEWGVAEDAIIIRAHNPQRGTRPLSEMFSASLHRDYGIQAAHIEFGEYESLKKTTKASWSLTASTSTPVSDADIEASRQLDVGYIPRTVVQIRTRGRGFHANTPTPILVDSFNDPVDIRTWRSNLRGTRFLSRPGDHILPCLNNYILEIDSYSSNEFNVRTASNKLGHALILAGQEDITNPDRVPSFGERLPFYHDDTKYALVFSKQTPSATGSETKFTYTDQEATAEWQSEFGSNTINDDFFVMRFIGEIDGYRLHGSVDSEPVTYFRGARDSGDHSVPLYFGGGFSGIVLDVNDGTQNDYSDFYTHPYSSGPTGTAGIQHANEISTSFALVDCNALLAFFPGTALLNQHRASIHPPVYNKTSVLAVDLDGGSGTRHSSLPSHVESRYTVGMVYQKPSPLILRVAHPIARYDDAQNSKQNYTAYIVYGPGQAFPFTETTDEDAAVEPHPGYVVTTGNTWSKVPFDKYLPNTLTNDRNDYGPPTGTYQIERHRHHWFTKMNWSPAEGIPYVGAVSSGKSLWQRPEHGYHFGEHFNTQNSVSSNNVVDYAKAHPYKHAPTLGYGAASQADYTFHMDGGYHPGGSWLDNQMSFNAPLEPSDYRVAKESWNQVNPTAFRVSGVLAKQMLAGSSAEEGDDFDRDFIIVDATRCQNGEELAAVLGQAVNENPGRGALKAMGGTHLPSMGNAMRQDRYGWIELTFTDYDIDGSTSRTYVEASGTNQATLEQLPASGWIRTDKSGRTLHSIVLPAFAPYHSREVYNNSGTWTARFYLAPNRIEGHPKLEDAQTHSDSSHPTEANVDSNATKVYVWSKAGVHRYNNENESARTHMTQVHFAGIVDAIDRTRPVGVVGWSGERYSYLNSLKVGTEGYAAGLGAYHPKLGFSPYGAASTVMNGYGQFPHVYALENTPESLAGANYQGNAATNYLGGTVWNITTAPGSISYTMRNADTSGAFVQQGEPVNTQTLTDFTIPDALHHPQGVFGKGFLVMSYESELALVAKRDRDGITALGDWLSVSSKTRAGVAAATAITFAGTVQWDERIHGAERYYAPATAGPNVEALIGSGTATPTGDLITSEYTLHSAITDDNNLFNATPAAAKIGDLFFDYDESPGSGILSSVTEVERNLLLGLKTAASSSDFDTKHDDLTYWLPSVNGYKSLGNTPVRNFSVEHVVWKRMDGGNLSLPALNARGLGSVPFVTRVNSGTAYLTGEKLYGNVRFSFETTNSSMFPIIQAQELAHPQIAARHPEELRNVLVIPNEEVQFAAIEVEDDTGQVHTVEGGSPFGTIIRGFRKVSNRASEGLSPAIAGSGVEPNLKVRLPDPDTIPGNIIVRSGFDRLQAYQTETMGSGGMLRPDLGTDLKHLWTTETSAPRTYPTGPDHQWEHISQGAGEGGFPDPTFAGWEEATGNAPLETSYELHDRTLFFHVTKCGNTHTHKHPTHYDHTNGVQNSNLTGVSYSGTTLTVSATVDAALFSTTFGDEEAADNRRFLRLYNPTTDRGGVASFTGISGATFTGCVGDADFDELVKTSITSLKVVPSYYIPAGSTRFFASRRLRDHSEISGNSPDAMHTMYYQGVSAATNAHAILSKPKLTPMAVPRMGHHFVTPTMGMLPGHWAHPAYQGLYNKHRAIRASSHKFAEQTLLEEVGLTTLRADIASSVTDQFNNYDPQLVFGSLSATPSGPSDIHGGAFTLMFESKVRTDGYGVLASEGQAGVINSKGGHSIALEAAATYTLSNHFPDPAEVGSYQIVIQPNMHKSQLIGYHQNNSDGKGLPDGSVAELTNQQVALVVGIKEADSTRGARVLVLAEATSADVRGCEVFINEVMLDHDPDHGSQFTNIPPLLLYNPLGVQSTETPAFVRHTLPYHPGMFVDATPGFTTNIPWWSIVHRNGPSHATSVGFRHLNHHRFDNYYEFIRAGAGSVGVQLTLAGYPSQHPDIYSKVFDLTSLNPVATATSATSSAITVADARMWPQRSYYNQLVEYVDANGIRRTNKIANVSSTSIGLDTAPSAFHSNITNGTKVRLTRAYGTFHAGSVFLDSKSSMITRMLPQVLQGSRDTNSLHVPDAFLCMWHPNLGRPYTFYSDSTRTFLNPASDRAVDNKPYNSMPEHFETFHYHDAPYFASVGPFGLGMKTPNPVLPLRWTDGTARTVQSINTGTKTITTNPDAAALSTLSSGDVISIAGRLYTVSSDSKFTGAIVVNQAIDAEITTGSAVFTGGIGDVVAAGSLDSYFTAQGSTGTDTTQVTLNNYWPCGSRGGPLVSRLDGYGFAASSWTYTPNYGYDRRQWIDQDDDGSYAVSSGITSQDYEGVSNPTRALPFGYRFGLRQPYNRPQWSRYGMAYFRDGSLAGWIPEYAPYVQADSQTWPKTDFSSAATYPATYVGVMERQTNFSGMLGVDMAERQVRYSDGMRMTRSFGAPVRTLRNQSTVIRDWWGDDNGKDLERIDEGVMYYMVDWWGNTRGEEVRRFPVRSFGIRPAWDAGDAYDPGRNTDATPYERLYNSGSPLVNLKGIVGSGSSNISLSTGVTIPRFGGRQNTSNNNNANTLVDLFMPATAMRVGDMGNGRGVRYPTQFNEDRLTALNEADYTTGVVLSHHTAEPVFGDGFIRARNDTLALDEVPRGISARLEIDDDGLLKPEAVVSSRVETVTGSTKHTDAVSRSAPRIGLDTENIEGVDDNLIALNTEAHSLHADRGVGQRVVLVGGLTAGSQTIGDLDYKTLNFGSQPVGGAARFSHTSNFNPLGGTYVAETRNFLAPVSDLGWGAVSGKAANPYATSTFSSASAQTNFTDKTISFLLRPVRLLDDQHVEMFRPNNNLHSGSPQYGSNYFSATGGGKYGLFAYDMPSGRAADGNYIRATNPDTNPPYAPAYYMNIGSSDSNPASKGPNLGGTHDMSTSLDNDVTRVVMSENTLQHHRSDASRRRTSAETDDIERRADYSVKPRFSQSLHPKGHKGDVDYGTSDHSGDGA